MGATVGVKAVVGAEDKRNVREVAEVAWRSAVGDRG